jgi:HK97 family phage portal protein
VSVSLLSRLFGVRAEGSGNPLDDRYYPELAGAAGRMSPEMALKVAAVYRCVAIRANIAAFLPLGVYEDLGRDGDEGKKRRALEHPMDLPLRLRPNRRQTSFEWRRQLNVSLLLRGNAYCQIRPGDRRGAFELIPLHPDRMRGPEETSGGELRWYYEPANGQRVPLLDGFDLWHLKGLNEDGLKGLAMTDLASDTFGIAASAEKHTKRFFDRGVKLAGVLEHPGRLKAETANEIGDSFGRRFGGVEGQGRVPVLWEGMQYKVLSMTHKDAEFLESRKFEVTDVARWFGVPPHLVADVEKSTSWGTGIEEQNLGFLLYTILPDLTLWEQRIRHDLLAQPERFYARFNVSALLRASTKVRYEVYQIAITNGILSPNECRELEDRNPRDGGDEYLTPMNMRQGSQPAGVEPLPPDGEKAAIAIAHRLAEELSRPPRSDATGASERTVEAVLAGIDVVMQARDRAAAADARARALARFAAGLLVDRELAELRDLAEKAGKSGARWRHAVTSFYGRHGGPVAEAMGIPLDTVRAWCRERQEEVIANGLPVEPEPWRSGRIAALVDLAVAAPVGPAVSVVVEAPAPVVVPAPAVQAPPPVVIPAAQVSVSTPETMTVKGSIDVRVTEAPDPPVMESKITRDKATGQATGTVTRPKR